jgi:hypothetical protein
MPEGSARSTCFLALGGNARPRTTVRTLALLGLGFLSRPTARIFLWNLLGAQSLIGEQSHRTLDTAMTLFPWSHEAVLATSSIGSHPGCDATQQGQTCASYVNESETTWQLTLHAARPLGMLRTLGEGEPRKVQQW